MSRPTAMKERPINMRAEEVRAILAGRKTQLRRVIREVPTYKHLGRSIMDWSLSGVYTDQHGNHWLDVQTDVDDYSHDKLKCPFGAPGDMLWVRECWKSVFESDTGFTGISFFSGGMPEDDRRAGDLLDGRDRWRPSVHMPRWACRITLEVASVKVERLNEISEEDAIAEGVERLANAPKFFHGYGKKGPNWHRTARGSFESVWQATHGSRSWEANPFVWAVEFRRLEGAQ